MTTPNPHRKTPTRHESNDPPPMSTPMQPEQGSGYIPTLDGWRAIAILGVIVYHGATTLFYPLGPYPSYEALKVIQVGHRGVDVFFAISGFLICSRLIRERVKTGRISLSGFYLRRAFRILPPFLVYLAVIAGMTAAGLIAVEGREFVGSLLFVRNYYGGPVEGHGWYTGHLWSLAVEEHFYLAWPLLMIVLSLRWLRVVTPVLALLVPVWVFTASHFGWPGVGNEKATDVRIDAILWGCWAALLVAVPACRAWIVRWLRPWTWGAVVVLLALLVRYETPVGRHAESFLIPWLLVGTVLNPGWRVSRLLEAGPVRWVGRLSYSLYIWQQLWMFGRFTVPRPFDLGPFQELPLNLLCVFVCAVLSYYLVEKPMIRLGTRLVRARTEPQAVGVVRAPEYEMAR